MTTNQTIDGVPRDRMISGDLLERLTNAPSIRAHGEALDELRSLLDAPAENVIDVSAVSWAAIQEAASESTWMPPEYMRNDWVDDVCRFLREGPATQPHGEPVKLPAKKYPKDWNKGALRSCNMEYMEGYNDAVDDVAKLGPLYAEQPAPVAMVLPVRKGSHHTDWRDFTFQEIGYNTCIDDVIRLNGGA